jgi:diguanylate cyclase (GGDEF)-like protein
MKPLRYTNPPQRLAPAKALTKALAESERVKVLVEESAEELSSVNSALEHEVAEHAAPAGVERALAVSVGVETKVQQASEKLSDVNLALKDEVRERHILEDRFAAATDRGAADHHAALHDPLTGLPNRTLLDDRLDHGLAQATRHGWKLAVMFLDLDGFKEINDAHGHDAGDSLLRTVALRLGDLTRADDTVGRCGGDEFLCLLVDPRSERDLSQIAEKFIKAIQVPCEITESNGTVSVSVKASIGISVFPANGTTADQLTKSADTAMYQAKRNRSGYAFA